MRTLTATVGVAVAAYVAYVNRRQNPPNLRSLGLDAPTDTRSDKIIDLKPGRSELASDDQIEKLYAVLHYEALANELAHERGRDA
ncbi:MAG TPA: hypothetical protein VGJ86_05945 [Acidimicrobiales bacterium]